jgi:hypothetical protein
MQKYGWVIHLPVIRYACILSHCVTSRMLMYFCAKKNCELLHGTHIHPYILKAVVEIKTEACNCSIIVSSQLAVSTCRTAML